MISVVVATYNGEAYVTEQLRSILKCIGPCDEVIVSDDCSTDGTIAAIRALSEQRVHIIENSARVGYQANFERAIQKAAGELIFFSDQDDVWLDTRVSASLAALKTADLVGTDAIVVDQSLKTIAPSYFALRSAGFSAAKLFFRPSVIGATVAVRRSFLTQLLPFPNDIPHDHWLSVAAASASRLAIVREPTILYRRHDGAASATALSSRRRSLWVIASERFRLALALAALLIRSRTRSGNP